LGDPIAAPGGIDASEITAILERHAGVQARDIGLFATALPRAALASEQAKKAPGITRDALASLLRASFGRGEGRPGAVAVRLDGEVFRLTRVRDADRASAIDVAVTKFLDALMAKKEVGFVIAFFASPLLAGVDGAGAFVFEHGLDKPEPGGDFVIELTEPSTVLALDDASLVEVKGTAAQVPVQGADATVPYDGRHVLLCALDYGCDFVQRGFSAPGGGTRLRAIWDQNIPGAGQQSPVAAVPGGFGYGQEFFDGPINWALTKRDPYAALRYDPDAHYYLPGPVAAEHGTQVLDAAGGNGEATGAPGVAPGADLLFVQVAGPPAGAHAPWTAGEVDVIDGLLYAFYRAGQEFAINPPNEPRHAVVNVSLGHNRGAHSGRQPTELVMDALLLQERRAIVVAAGNGRGGGWHASGRVSPAAPRRLSWDFAAPEDWNFARHYGRPPIRNDLEIWYEAPQHRLEITLVSPTGHRLGPVAPGTARIVYRDGDPIGVVSGSMFSAINDAYCLKVRLLAVNDAAESWGVRLRCIGPPQPTLPNAAPDGDAVHFHAWIHSDDPSQSQFAPADQDPRCTLSGWATGERTIVVGAYDGLSTVRSPAPFTSAGPTRDGRPKPELSAPGVGVEAALSKGDRPLPGGWRTASRAPVSGTSIAAPHVAGAIALLYQKNPGATLDDIRQALVATARPDPPYRVADKPPAQPIARWDALYGAGRLDVAAALDAI
jgi:subtilisin family serine protease